MQQGAGQAVEALVQMLFIGTVNDQLVALDLQDHVGMEGVVQSALGALHGNVVALGNIHRDVCRNDNRLSTNSRHF